MFGKIKISGAELTKAETLRTDELELAIQLNSAGWERMKIELSLAEEVRANKTTGDLALDLSLFKLHSIDTKNVTRYRGLINLIRGQSGRLVLTWHTTTENTELIEHMCAPTDSSRILPSILDSSVTTYHYRVGILNNDSPVAREQKRGLERGLFGTQYDCLLPTARHVSFSCSGICGMPPPYKNPDLEILVEEGDIQEDFHFFVPWEDTKTPNKYACYIMVGDHEVEMWLKRQYGDKFYSRVLELLGILVLTPPVPQE